jgi:hypothetical protein
MYNIVHAHEYVMADFLYDKSSISDIDCLFFTATQDAQMECEVSFVKSEAYCNSIMYLLFYKCPL